MGAAAKVLKRDMTALYGVRRVLELEQTFLYLCLHDGGLLDMAELGKNLQVKKPTATNYITLLEAAHLIHRLLPFGYGKEILRGRSKVYLADAIKPLADSELKGMVEFCHRWFWSCRTWTGTTLARRNPVTPRRTALTGCGMRLTIRA